MKSRDTVLTHIGDLLWVAKERLRRASGRKLYCSQCEDEYQEGDICPRCGEAPLESC
jgi:rRNA maturation endonuclease Nob1